MSDVEQMKKNRVCDIAAQNQNKQCFWQKVFPFPAHCGPFSMSSLQTHKCRHWWDSNATQTHLEKCNGKRKKDERTEEEKYTLQCFFFASYNAAFRASTSIDHGFLLLLHGISIEQELYIINCSEHNHHFYLWSGNYKCFYVFF